VHTFDLDGYLERIGYSGPQTPTFGTLAQIHLRHTEAIPFENLNPFLKWPVSLDVRSLEQKLIREGRGGYCFEHNLLLRHALEALGFETTGLAARVLWKRAPGEPSPRTHMLLLVDLNDRAYIADVGFGGLTLTAPLRLDPDVEQRTPHETFRLVKSGGQFTLEARIRSDWRALYRFDLQEQMDADYEVANWYASTHPQSPFVTGLVAARHDPLRRYTLRDNELAIHHVRGRTERLRLGAAADLLAALEGVFRLRLPRSPELQAALEQLTAQAA
jgi:N-hydroxyarylamine O-acetyltransferase